MSPVVDLQRRMREIGRIRMGEKRISKKGNPYPAALETFRFTSSSEGILQAMAATVGGEVRQWEDQFELTSTARDIAVVVPPMDEPYSQWYELWSAAGCQRRCDGERATVATERGDEIVMSDRKCVCNPDNRECKLTTRASFILPWAPGIGVWRLESHGYNAAVELTGTLAYLARQASQGVYMECRLRLEKREKRVPGQPTNEYVVPVIDTDATPAQLMAGEPIQTQPVIASRERPAIPAAKPAPAGDGAGFTDPAAEVASPSWGSAPPPPVGEAAKRAEPEPDVRVISEAQRKRRFAISRDQGVTNDQVKAIILEITGQDSTAGVPRDKYDAVVETVEAVGEGALFAPERKADVA